MASLISYKQVAREYPAQKGKYLGCFTLANIVMLAVLFIDGAQETGTVRKQMTR